MEQIVPVSIDDITPSPSSLKSKMVQGIPECISIPLEPARIPDGFTWAVNKHEMVLGIISEEKGIIQSGVLGWSPVSLPRVKIKRVICRVDYTSLDDAALCKLQLRYLDHNYFPHGFQTQILSCSGRPHFNFEIPLSHIALPSAKPVNIPEYDLLTLSLQIDPGPFEKENKRFGDRDIGGLPVIIRSARVEVYT